jgi:hypothetical protein
VVHGGPLPQPPVIVYQMAKVGSSSIVSALRRSGLPAFHVHRMSHEHLERLRGARRGLGWSVDGVPPHDVVGLALHDHVIARGRPARVVTVVREPIGRNLSSYFEHLDAIWQTPDAHRVIPVERLCEGFLERFTHDEPLTWFDDELRAVVGLDVYDHRPPHEGAVVVPGARADVLVLRSEADDRVKADALEAFLGRPGIALRPTNVTAAKPKGAAYREFQARLRLPPAYVDRMLASRYTQHFYTPDEREALYRRYTR